MEEKTILRFDVLRLIDTGDPFDLVFITADRKRGTGGDIKEVKAYRKIKHDIEPARAVGAFGKVFSGTSRNPNHSENKTVNIYDPANPDDHAISVHWRLMIFFNQQRIIG